MEFKANIIKKDLKALSGLTNTSLRVRCIKLYKELTEKDKVIKEVRERIYRLEELEKLSEKDLLCRVANQEETIEIQLKDIKKLKR